MRLPPTLRLRINDFFNEIRAERKCQHGSLPAAIRGIPENKCSL